MAKPSPARRTQPSATPSDEGHHPLRTHPLGPGEDTLLGGPQHDWLVCIFPDARERSRYASTLRRLSMKPVSAWRLADRARLRHRLREIRAALRRDLRFARVEKRGPERYVLLPAYRHVPEAQA